MNYEVKTYKGKQGIASLLNKRYAKLRKSKAERLQGKAACRLYFLGKEVPTTFKTPRKGWID